MWGRVPTALAKPISVAIPNLRPHHQALPATLQANQLARLAPSAAVLSTPTTTILATAAQAPQNGSISNHIVDFRLKAAAVGIIPSTWSRREQQPAIFETLTARLIDRSVRPVLNAVPNLPPTQLTISVLSAARTSDAPIDALAANAAAAALAISDVAYKEPVAAARVALFRDDCVPFPSDAHLQNASLSVYVAVNNDRNILALSVHARSGPVPEDEVLLATKHAISSASALIPAIAELRTRVQSLHETEGKSSYPPQQPPKLIDSRTPNNFDMDTVYNSAVNEYKAAFVNCREHPGKAHRAFVLTDVQHRLLKMFAHFPQDDVLKQLSVASRAAYRAVLVRDKCRIDGRALHEVRPIRCSTAILPGDVHGSALFERGDTQVLACTTFGHQKSGRRTEEYVDSAGGVSGGGFFVHYSFPPFATGEYGKFGSGIDRREVGHSVLTERAIQPLLGNSPQAKGEDFPYALRVSTDVLSSDGSSSMASVCAGSLAIMDAGAPLREPIAGIAMGLVKGDRCETQSGKEHDIILTDILGAEDHFGDMDLKIAGTASGITACQMDVKTKAGIPVETLGEIFERAKEGRQHILNRMIQDGGLKEPREMSDSAPRLVRVAVNRERARNTLYRDRFRGLRAIGELCDSYLKVGPAGDEIVIEGPNKTAAEKARDLVQAAVREIRVGDVMICTIVDVKKTFALVEAVCGCISGIVHVSKMSLEERSDYTALGDYDPNLRKMGTYPNVRSFLNVGDKVQVEVIETDSSNSALRFRLIHKSNKDVNRLASEIDSVLRASQVR